MKLAVSFALIFLTLVSYTKVPFLPEVSEEDKCDNRVNAGLFLEGLWSHFDLERPKQAIACFSDCEAGACMFLEGFYAVNKLLVDSAERKSFAVHIDSLKIDLLGKALTPVFGCIMMTQDFTDLLDVLKIKERNAKAFGFYLSVYYQDYYPTLGDDFKPLIENLDNNDYIAAGDVFGCLLNQTVSLIKDDGVALEIFSAFSNGASSELDLDFPDDSLDCHNSNTAETLLVFLYELSKKVSDGKMKEAPLNALNYWSDKGRDLLKKLPDDVVACYLQSDDITALSKKLGIRVWSPAFKELLKRYIINKPSSFYAYMKSIRSSFEDLNFVHAGYALGHFLDSVSDFLPYFENDLES